MEADNSRGGRWYRVRVVHEIGPEGSRWTAEHPDLPGCHVVDTDPTSAVNQLSIVREEWLARARKSGMPIPPATSNLIYIINLAGDHTEEHRRQAEQAKMALLTQDSEDTVLIPA